MPPQEPQFHDSGLTRPVNSSTESLDMMRSDYIQGSMKKYVTVKKIDALFIKIL